MRVMEALVLLLNPRGRKVVVVVVKGREKEGRTRVLLLPAAEKRMGGEGVRRNSFCIPSEHFTVPTRERECVFCTVGVSTRKRGFSNHKC